MRKIVTILAAGGFCACLCGPPGGVFLTHVLRTSVEASQAGYSTERALAHPAANSAIIHGFGTISRDRTEAPRLTAPQSAYADIAISRVSNYVNVRKEPNTASGIVGRIYNNCAATILETVNGEGGLWYRIQSGSVNGYIKAQYFVTGAQAEAIARQVGTEFGTVTGARNLRLREAPDLNSATLTMLSEGGRYEVLEEAGDFYKIMVDNELTGYASKQYMRTEVEFKQAVSLEEEKAKAQEIDRRRREAEEALVKLQEVKQIAEGSPIESGNSVQVNAPAPTGGARASADSGYIAASPIKGGTGSVDAPQAGSSDRTSSSKGPSAGPSASTEVVSATRTAIVAYAKQFVGNPYVYGGTSLTQGADCSGFTMSIFAHFGISTGRSSRDQSVKGREIPVNEVQPGDLLFYASGANIDHVALYIGGGQVIHASSPTKGIVLAPSNYRTPCKAVTFLD